MTENPNSSPESKPTDVPPAPPIKDDPSIVEYFERGQDLSEAEDKRAR